MMDFFHNLFIPSYRNNHRAKILHNLNIFILTLILFSITITASILKTNNPSVLGISYSLSENDLLSNLNKTRITNGLQPLTINNYLSQAARLKAQDMINKNYWAHFAPDGTSPWDFIKSASYDYIYAGENLAKGFTSSDEVTKAWMDSPSHRDNMLSSKYDEVGFAVVEGKLLGEDTVLVVELFGSTEARNLARSVETPNKSEQTTQSVPSNKNNIINPIPIKPVLGNENTIKVEPLVNLATVPRNILFIIFSIFIFVFFIDLIIVEKKKIPRLVGHNVDHIVIIMLFILLMVIQKSGTIF